jgi:hypothetical protein
MGLWLIRIQNISICVRIHVLVCYADGGRVYRKTGIDAIKKIKIKTQYEREMSIKGKYN